MAPGSIGLNMTAFDKIAATLAYYKLFEHIMNDFMGKADCMACHTAGNIMFNGSNAGGPVSGPCINIVTQGGSDNMNQTKKAAYLAALKAGAALDKITGSA